MTEITMPSLSDSMSEGTILTWLKEEGEQVTAGDELVEIETDKATMAYESPAAGTLHIVAAVGETLPVGQVIAQLAVAGEAAGEAAAGAAGEAAGARPSGRNGAVEDRPAASAGDGAAARPAGHTDGGPRASAGAPAAAGVSPEEGAGPATEVKATPLARRLARAHGIDLAAVEGTGPRGRITRSDVAGRAGIEVPGPPTPAPASQPTPAPAPAHGDGVTTYELSRLQQVIARRMSESKATIPHFQVQTEARVDTLLDLRAELKATAREDQIVPSVNDFLVKAAALALRRHPRANGSYRDGRFVLHERVNVGVAVAAEEALIVPTIFDADRRSVGEIAAEARRLTERVRAGRVTPPELSGATFTVSNLGMFGMTAITPVINPPQAAILGVGAPRELPALDDGRLVSRQLLTLTLSCDHRILYGADAARLLSRIRAELERPLALML
jgi:pyruvate dehydrogenase E2 component (dihydrolipoamide acetyltransferase)